MIEVTIYWTTKTETYTITARHYPTYQTLPYLLEIGEISRAVNLDGAIENSTVEIVLSNHDGHFNDLLDELNRKIVITDEDIVIFTGYICDFPESEYGYFKIKGDIFSFLEAPINLEINKTRFPSVPPENEGWGNILYGTANVAPGMLNARRINTNKYLASYTPLSSIIAVQKNGVDVTSLTTWEVDPETGYTYINHNSTENILTFSALGPTTGGTLIENPALMLQDLVENFSTSITLEGITESSSIFSERGYTGNITYIDDNMTWISLFKLFSMNFNCKVIFTRAGQVKIKVIRWGMETPVKTIPPNVVKDFVYTLVRSMKNRWTRKFQYIPVVKEYKMTPVDIPGNTAVNSVGEFEQKYVAAEATSTDVALREAFFLKKKIIEYTFSLPRKEANSLEIGDTIYIRHRKNLFSEYRQVQILRESRKPGTGFIQFTGYDMTEINKRTFILQAADHPEVAVLGNEENSPVLW